jgi:hypothetical protein
MIMYKLKFKLLLVLLFLSGNLVNAQVSAYTFTQVAGAPTALSPTYTTHTTGTTDDATFPAISIGFNFFFDCVSFSTVSISNNGYIVMGNTITNSYTPLSTGANNYVIAALARDLQGLTTGSLRSKLTGTAPNRQFTVEWQHYEAYLGADDYSFSIILTETTNTIQIQYDASTTVAGNDFQVGLRGASNADFNNRTKINSTNWTASGAGGTNAAVMSTGGNAARNPTGIFTWTPTAAFCTGTPTGGTSAATPGSITVCTSLSSVLSLTGSSTGCGISYQWQSAPAAGGPWTNIVGATSTPYTLTPPSGTTFYRCVLTCSTSGLTANSSTTSISNTAPVVSNNECATATPVPVNAAPGCSSIVSGTVNCSSASPDANTCFGTADDDVWFSFVATGATINISLINVAGSTTDLYHSVYSGTCGSLTNLSCSDPNTSSVTGLIPGNTYFIRVYTWTSTPNQTTTFDVCLENPCPGGAPVNDECTNATLLGVASGVCSTPTAGTISCATPSVQANTCFGTADDDVWYRFVATGPTAVIDLTSISGSTTDMYHSVYSGTCGAIGAPLVCSDPNSSSVTGLTAGNTYYIRVYTYTSTGSQTVSFNICVTNPCPGGAPANDECTSATSIPVSLGICSSPTAGTISCATASPQSNTCFGTADDDVWFSFVATNTYSNIDISSVVGSTTDLYHSVYSGTCGAIGAPLICSDPNSSVVTGLTVGLTYYIRVYTWTSTANQTVTFNICVTDPCPGGSAANDLPCNASLMTLGVTESGDNTCSGNTGDPAVPACWTGGTYNTVWYKVVTTGTTLKIKTSLGTLTNTQIAVYSGACGSLTFVTGSCNDNGPACGSSTILSSELSLTGLTPGATYHIAVDGNNNLTGTFGIVAIDGAATWPLVAGQECLSPNPVCSSTMIISDPGYQGIGNYCDIPSSYCLSSAERGSVWYSWTTSGPGNINFDIIPNNWPGAPSTIGADYDFALWRLGAGVTCATILAGTSAPVACNYSGLGVTGLSPTGNAPAAYPGFDASYEIQAACLAGETWILLINNHSTSVDGFTINFSTGVGGSPISYVTAPTSVSWTGGTSTAWNLPSNWGGCSFPICGIDATINPFTVMPVVTGNQYVRDLTINPGATLTLSAGSILHVCGNLLNSGTIIASPTSTIIFDNAAVSQTMTGNFIGASSLGNLTVNKTGGSLLTNDDITLQGTFTTSNSTSVFNSNGKYIRLAGHFYNATGNTTFTNTGTTGTLEFTGAAAQNYNQGTSVLDLNFVIMSHTGPGVTLQTDMNIKTVTGTITFTLGKIITTAAFQVYLKNKTPGACNAGNVNSFVQGYLRRGINTTTGVYEFPVGESVKLYQRATINFTTAPSTIDNIRADFVQYGVTPGALGTIDCTVPYNLPFLDNGKWNINAYNAAMTQITGNGVYTCTLWPRAGSYTNAASAIEWTVAKDPGTGWAIVGTCNLASVVNQVIRDAMSGFSGFGVEQSTTTLPVELISFTGENSNKNHLLKWTTASETNNQWFILEQSTNGVDFIEIYKTPGQLSSNALLSYEFNYKFPDPGLNYYRLRQINTNGAYAFSDIIVLDNTSGVISLTNLFPNPTSGNIQFDLTSSESGEFTIEIYDIAGKMVMQKKHTQEEGKQTVNLPMSELGRGVYTMKVFGQNSHFKSINRIVRN